MSDHGPSQKDLEFDRLFELSRALCERYSQPEDEDYLETLIFYVDEFSKSDKPLVAHTEEELDRWVRHAVHWIRGGSQGEAPLTQETLGAPIAHETPCAPPSTAEKLILLLAPKAVREALPGDLEEEFHDIADKHGARFARRWYWAQVALSSWPMIRHHIMNWLGLGIGVKLAEWMTRKLGR